MRHHSKTHRKFTKLHIDHLLSYCSVLCKAFISGLRTHQPIEQTRTAGVGENIWENMEGNVSIYLKSTAPALT